MTPAIALPWLVLDSGPGDAAFNMALDEVLLEKAPGLGRPVLRFYGWIQPAASFGYFQHIAEIEETTSLRPLIRRPTGGGLVPHDADWTYSVVIPPGHSWYQLRATESYERVHRWIQSAFASLQLETTLAPCCRQERPGQCFAGYEKSDVLRLGRKIAGAAQRRTKAGLLIQGSVQPPSSSIVRAAWQQAMITLIEGAFTEENLPPALGALAESRSEEKFRRAEYNRQR